MNPSKIGWQEVAFGAKCTLAALVAIFIAASENMTNPAWAGLTVFLVSQPMAAATGAVATRALHRMAGTLVGVAATLVIVPAFASSPEWLVGALAGWIALCVFVSLLDRSPRSYAFVLAGYTVALVGLPLAATDPGNLFDLALARAEEILLGGACAVLVHTLIVPRSLKPALLGKVDLILGDAQRWILRSLEPEPVDASERALRMKLTADLTELRALARNLRIESGISGQDVAAVRALEERLVALLPLVTGLEERLSTSVADRAASAPELSRLLAAARGALRGDRPAHVVAGVEVPIDLEPSSDEPGIVGVAHRLVELLQVWNDCQALARALHDPEALRDERIVALLAEAHLRPLHVDAGLAAWSAFAAAASVIVASLLCWVLGWNQGAFAVGIAASASSLFAAFDDPRPFIRLLLFSTVLAIPVAALYAFALLPGVDGFPLLALTLGPLFFVTGVFLGSPKYSLAALGFALITQSLISVQPAYGADFLSFTSVAIATVFGSVVSLVVMSLVRVVGVEQSVWRLVRAGWRELAALAAGDADEARGPWSSRMLDRVGLLLPRMDRVEGVARARAHAVLNDLRTGVNVIELREASRELAGPARGAVLETLQRVAVHFRGLLGSAEQASEPALRVSLEAAIASLAMEPASAQRRKALTAITGLRAELFPALGQAGGSKGDAS